MEKRVRVWTTFQRVGFHSWPSAPTEVGYLSSQHRHVFKFAVCIDVTGLDRQIEFHTLNAQAQAFIDANYSSMVGLLVETVHALNFTNNSCEMIALDLAKYLSILHNKAPITVEVSEDGEHGAIVEIP